jgi:hypothetical protein
MIQMLLSNHGAVFLGDSAYIQRAGTVQSWFEGHEVEFQHIPWPAQSPYLNII